MIKYFQDKNYVFIITACLLSITVYLIFEYYFTDGKMGVPLDDTWIHFRFADNFINGYFFNYNPGEPTAGTTSPFYVVILGISSLLIPNFIINSVFLSGLFYIFTCLIVYKISLLIFENSNIKFSDSIPVYFTPQKLSLIISLLTVFAGRFAWAAMSGMETTLFTFFTLAGVYFHLNDLRFNKFSVLPTFMFALSSVLRPEGMLIYSIYAFDVTLNFIKDKTFKANILKFILFIFLFLLVTLPYLIFSYQISGHFFPNTFRGQGGGFSLIPNFNYLRIVSIFFLRDNFVTGILFFGFIFYYFKNYRTYFSDFKYLNLIALWAIFLPLVSSVLIPNWRHHVRYTMPLIPFVNIIAVYTLFTVFKKQYYRKLTNFLRPKTLTPVFLILFSFIYYFVYAVALGKNVDNINSQQVKLAEWVQYNVRRNETIAVNDIGAITFLSNNRVIDMAGLITPEILRYRTYSWDDNLDSVNYLLKKNDVAYIIIYDHWFKEYLEKYGSELTFITSAILEENTICGGIEMKVYKTNFNRQ
ncbi:MAG TPA: hypothetical protein PK536_08785 [Ignavibacteria bacterium]|nr:hypothetical protein [Bacteroidota bacterium]HRI85530.1 hypothetical protein [Ignavibacteria bacterium]HRJ98170.1 hypothetical protein [Ignavibacteria bacterium]